MSFMDGIQVRKAMMKHQKGDFEGAMQGYEALYQKGYISCSYLLAYSVLLLRAGGEENYKKTKEILKKAEKASDYKGESRPQLLMNYAVAQFKLGETENALHLLESAHQKYPCGLIYEALGFIYIEVGDREKALSYNLEALEYDDESPVTLDNLGQVYYRLMDDKETARKYFERAIEQKDNQIDTLYFLALYDEEDGKRDAAVEKLEKALEGRFSPLNYATRERVEAELAKLKG